MRQRDGEVSVTQGPFAETNEVLGGFYLISADDLDAVVALVKEMPEQVIEIRRVVPPRD